MSQLDLFSPWVRQNTSNSEIATQLHNFLLDFRALIGPLRVYVSLLTCMRICVLVLANETDRRVERILIGYFFFFTQEK